MPVVALHEFNCILCQQTFELMFGDVIFPIPEMCEDCLREVWEMDEKALTAYVAKRLPEDAMFPVEKIVQHTQMIQANSESAEQAIENRKSFLAPFRQ